MACAVAVVLVGVVFAAVFFPAGVADLPADFAGVLLAGLVLAFFAGGADFDAGAAPLLAAVAFLAPAFLTGALFTAAFAGAFAVPLAGALVGVLVGVVAGAFLVALVVALVVAELCFAALFLPALFFAVVDFAVVDFAVVFAGAFFAGACFEAATFAGAFCAAACFAGAFLAVAFFAAVVLAAVPFLAEADFFAVDFDAAFAVVFAVVFAVALVGAAFLAAVAFFAGPGWLFLLGFWVLFWADEPVVPPERRETLAVTRFAAAASLPPVARAMSPRPLLARMPVVAATACREDMPPP